MLVCDNDATVNFNRIRIVEKANQKFPSFNFFPFIATLNEMFCFMGGLMFYSFFGASKCAANQ